MSDLSRREFVRAGTTAAALAGVGMAAQDPKDSPPIRVGVIGCGGRGSGAMENCLAGSPNMQVVAMGDMFEDRLKGSRANLEKIKKGGEKHPGVQVTDERMFHGFDAYKRVLDSGVDMVILATPPGFRPIHFEAAVEAGKHVFCEKPIASDPVGVRRFMAAGEKAKAKKLGVVAGTQRRHQANYVATIKRIHEGAIGKLLAGRCYWNSGGVWVNPRKPEQNDMDYMLRNWYYFTWLSGDHIAEQHIHNIDVMNWVFQAHPVKATAVGGRQVRTEEKFGHIYDHFAVDFEYPGGARVMSMCRHWPGASNVSEAIVGSEGRSNCAGSIDGKNPFKFEGNVRNAYDQEHTDLVNSIRAGTPLNEAQAVAESTLASIMGREAAYSGQEITWDQMLKSELNLMPEKMEFGSVPMPTIAIPGKYKFG